jgi:hypothetical protein
MRARVQRNLKMTDKQIERQVPEKNNAGSHANFGDEILTALKEHANIPKLPGGAEPLMGLFGHNGIEVPNKCEPIAHKPTTLDQLQHTSQDQLACLYHSSAAGKMPDGNTDGKAIFMPGSALGTGLSDFANTVWKGKVFDTHGGLVNKILGQQIVKAEVSKGSSWLDGKQSTIIDYKNTSLVAGWIRDEIREVSPGLYLGVAYARLPGNGRYPALFFALDANKKH